MKNQENYGRRLILAFIVTSTIGFLYQVASFYYEELGTRIEIINPAPAQAIEEVQTVIAPAVPSNDDLINEASKKYGVSAKLIKAILDCESDFRHDDLYGDNGMSYGWAQFQFKTFRWLKKLSGLNHLNYEDKEDQVTLLAWALANGRGGEWSCYHKVTGK